MIKKKIFILGSSFVTALNTTCIHEYLLKINHNIQKIED